MENSPIPTTPEKGSDRLDDVIALTNLVNMIVDYYSFKINVEEEDEKETWKKDDNEQKVVPGKLDKLIENAFSTQLKKFS